MAVAVMLTIIASSAGRLIGVNTAMVSPSGTYAGIGFAIPVDVVNRVAPQLIREGKIRALAVTTATRSPTTVRRRGICWRRAASKM